ncbi:hypothetical protein [Aureimonas glaciei]|uniref:Uncharacterized protein n=1 Tax=Aureimonas glaciei TaxID=1776957 RepID=A0A916XXR5_9HYPH|nr:hypothetical protein [Aureimonas glaciei]GGD20100.1 hypothetical protein GCM10011335_23770 [Aureimonas glaciei]
MWKFIAAIALLVSAAPASAETAAEFIKADNPTVIKDVGGNTSPSDAMLVGVINDGSRRDGFAEYVCLATSDFPDRPRVVRVMDVAAGARGEWKVLGQATCAEPGSDETVVEFN